MVSRVAMLTLLVGQDNWTLGVKCVTTTTGRFGSYCLCIWQWGQ